MSYRNILVHVEDTAAGRNRAAAAVNLSLRFKSALSGVFLRSDLIPNYVVGDGMIAFPQESVEQFLAERQEESVKAEAAVRQVFETAARGAGGPANWLNINGDREDELIFCARRHDLCVLPASMTPVLGQNVITAAQVGMASGGPILIVPPSGYPANFGRKILVAWKECREAARALRDAWPFLSAAEEVTLLTADPNGATQMDDLMQQHLRSNGCKKARLIVERDTDVSTGELIRRHVDMIGADMLVLGLYGHSRLREFVLGGVSRHLMSTLPMPLLASH